MEVPARPIAVETLTGEFWQGLPVLAESFSRAERLQPAEQVDCFSDART